MYQQIGPPPDISRNKPLYWALVVVLLSGSFRIITMGAASSLPPLKPVTNCDTARFMGHWFVIGVKPTFLETTCSNSVEKYTWVRQEESKRGGGFGPWSNDIDIDFTYNKDAPITSAVGSVPQKGWIQGDNKANSGAWKVSPFWPIKAPYLILEVDEANYDYTLIGYPSRDYLWIMSRKPQMDESVYKMLTERAVEKHQYSLEGLRRVPQVWTAEERTKRGLTEKEIPDSLLVKEPPTTK
ncbi:hypothetical protein MPSEU_000888100 [Mayamaea pseudoterrestris]|nr:hypothetical protein MPSEU_000888100 [Mayamaea pseudoterrestris]